MAKNKKIMVVEDHDKSRELLVLFIRRLGYDVVEAIDGIQALDQAATLHPDLILMDLSMPRLSGQEATTCLKADPATRDIPVIVITAYTHCVQLDSAALEAGALKVFRKPIDFVALGEILGRLLAPAIENDDHSTPKSGNKRNLSV
jgi:CheY-like chemotaxis protein